MSGLNENNVYCAMLEAKCSSWTIDKLCKNIRRETKKGNVKAVGVLMVEYEKRTLPVGATPEQQHTKTMRDLEALQRKYAVSGGFGFD